MARTNEKTRTVRVDDETWKRMRMAALEDDKSLGDELVALLDRRDRDETRVCNECGGDDDSEWYCGPCKSQYADD